MAFVNSISSCTNRTSFNGGPFKYVQTPNGTLYAFNVGPGPTGTTNSHLYYHKSTDYGRTWSSVQLDSDTNNVWLSVWYDRWSGISGDLIHFIYTDVLSDDVFYRTLNTSTDTLGTERTVFLGVSAVNTAGATGSVTVARGGNIYVYYDIDAGTEFGFYRSTDGGINWSSRAALAEATLDGVILMPGYAADNQDIMAFFWDASADEISRKIYDDSANTWAETSISTLFVEPTASAFQYGWSAVPDLTNSKNILIAWNGADTANADLKAWSVDESTITALTDVVANGTDDQYLCALSLRGTTLTAFYCGKSDGTEIAQASWAVYLKRSTDGGTTWGSETAFLPLGDYRGIFAPPITYAGDHVMVIPNASSTTVAPLLCSVSNISPGTNGQIGMN